MYVYEEHLTYFTHKERDLAVSGFDSQAQDVTSVDTARRLDDVFATCTCHGLPAAQLQNYGPTWTRQSMLKNCRLLLEVLCHYFTDFWGPGTFGVYLGTCFRSSSHETSYSSAGNM